MDRPLVAVFLGAVFCLPVMAFGQACTSETFDCSNAVYPQQAIYSSQASGVATISPQDKPKVDARDYTGADICAQAVAAETANPGADVMMPVSNVDTISHNGPVACSVDPTSGLAANTGMLEIIPYKGETPSGTSHQGNVQLAIDVPWHMSNNAITVTGPVMPRGGASKSSSNAGVQLVPSANFITNYAGTNRKFNTSASISIAQENSDAGCWIVTYASSAPSYQFVIRGTELVQLSGFTSAGNNGIFRVMAGNGSTGDTFGDPFCTNGTTNQHATEPSNGTQFLIYNPYASACGAGSCGSPVIYAPTYMVYLGWAPTDSDNSGTSCSSAHDSHCCLTLQGSPNVSSCTPVAQGVQFKNIGLSALGNSGIGGVACLFCQEGSGYINDGTVLVRTPFPAYVSWSAESQNNEGVKGLEYYCNDFDEGATFTCQQAASGNSVAVWAMDAQSRRFEDITAIAGSPNSNCAIMIDGQSAPQNRTASSGAAGPVNVGAVHVQSFNYGVCVGTQEPTVGAKIDGPHANSLNGANVLVWISCNFNGGGPCSATGLTSPSGAGNQTSDITILTANASETNVNIENDITGNNWTDKVIAAYFFHKCRSGNSNCTGTSTTEFSSSNQFPSRFDGGLTTGGNTVVSTPGGTSNTIPVFSGSATVQNSLLSDSGTQLTYTGTAGLQLSGGLQFSGSTMSATTIATSHTNQSLFFAPNGTGEVVFPAGNSACSSVGFNMSGNGGNTGFIFGSTTNTVYCSSGNLVFDLGNNSLTTNNATPFSWTSSSSAGGTVDTGLSRDSAGVVDIGSGASGSTAGSAKMTNMTASGVVSGATYGTASNCSSHASPAVCGSAAAGSVVIAAAATSVVVDTSAVTASSQILVQSDDTLSTKLSVTCNTVAATIGGPFYITARTAGTSFTISTGAGPGSVNPVCLSYLVVN
jgi:hypothetical protein